jgi:hypothetical protein
MRYEYKYTVDDIGHSFFSVIDNELPQSIMAECDQESCADFIVESLNCIDKQLNG